MDTISRENNSVLPLVGVGLGVIALAIGGYAAANISKVKATLATHDAKLAQIPDDIATQVSGISAKADKSASDIAQIIKQTSDGFTELANRIGTVNHDVTALQESMKRPAARAGKGGGGPVVAGPGEYVVKGGDTLSKIARANGCTVSELQSVNPGVDSKHLHPGQKLKVPEKASAAPAAAPAPAATP